MISEKESTEVNTLFPVFIKLEKLCLLIVGGGFVGLEKLNAVIQNSPATRITLVATAISDEIKTLSLKHSNILLIERPYHRDDLIDIDLVIVAVNDQHISEQIQLDSHSAGKLINVADIPEFCDFYLGSVVRKGNLKIAISTNGKSPTIAKRLKELFNDLLPEELNDLLDNMQSIRGKLSGDIAAKIIRLNEITRTLAPGNILQPNPGATTLKKVVIYIILIVLSFSAGYFFFLLKE